LRKDQRRRILALLCGAAPFAAAIVAGMRNLAFMFIIAALSACGDIVIGPVDHSCHVNPSKEALGSGCGGGGH
jgi:hypothetical protein